MNNRIKIIYPYYGSWPWYFPNFIHSCSHNPDVDFVLVTDLPVDINLPVNVSVLSLSLMDISDLATQQFGFKINITEPYKLNDFKPAYGLIFKSILKNYTFWGHGDIDVIFGNISRFITEELLNNYDIICPRHDYVPGYLTLYRNIPIVNSLFLKCKDYKRIFQSSENFCFDETNYTHSAFTEDLHYSEITSEVESMTHIVKRCHEERIIKAHFDFFGIEGLPGNLKWLNGKMIYKKEYEVLLYHLIKFKEVCNPKNNKHFIGNNFKITPSRIISINESH